MRLQLSNSKSIYYEVHGEGKPLLILNGIMMSTKSWTEFIDPLTVHNQLILVDFLDQGQSDKMEQSYTHSVQVRMILDLLNHLELEQINLFGISYGGEIAIQFALEHPTRVEKLLLFNTCAETSYWLEEVGNAWNKAAGDGEAYYYATIPYIYSPKFFAENRDWMEKRKEILVPVFSDKLFIESMIRLTNSSVGYNATKEIHKLTLPTLIVGSEYDFVTPFYQQKQLHEAIDDSQIVFVPDSGHAIMYEKPVLFTSLVIGFINNDKRTFQL